MTYHGKLSPLSWSTYVRGKLKSGWISQCFAILVLVLFALVVFDAEPRWVGRVVVIAVMIAAYCILRIIFLGPILSSYLTVLFLTSIFGASKFKFWLTARRLHPFDIYIYGSWRNILYIQDLYPRHYIYIYIGILAVTSLALSILFLEELRRPARRHFIGLVAIVFGFYGFSHFSSRFEGDGLGGGNGFMHFDQQHLSTFFISALKAIPELITGRYFDYGVDGKTTDPLKLATIKDDTCLLPTDQIAPNIVVVLRESIMVPSSIPAVNAPKVGDENFTSDDGSVHRLRVETHGAGSAHAILSVLSGLSMEAFGGTKTLSLDLSQTHLHYSLVSKMRNCGYRTLAISSGSDGYVASKDFYKSLGFEETYDMTDVTRQLSDHTDRAIYKFLATKFTKATADSRPVFAYLDTTASHAPYDFVVREEDNVPEAEGITDPIVAEYMRRLILGQRDYISFMESQRADLAMGGRPMVIMDFGDHQPYFTKSLTGEPGYVSDDVDQDDPLLMTFFRIKAAGYDLGSSGPPDTQAVVDIPFISDWLLHALGWKVGGLYAVRWDMVEKCKSRYWQCEHHAAAQELHRAMRDAGLITFR